MKSKIIFLIILAQTNILLSQETKESCLAKTERIKGYAAENKFTGLNTLWFEALKNCGQYIDEDFYLNGEKVFTFFYKYGKDATEKSEGLSNLIELYNLHDKAFPTNNYGNQVKKALLLYENKSETNLVIFNNLHSNFLKNKDAFGNPKALYIYYELLAEQYKLGNKTIKEINLFEKHFEVYQKILQKQDLLLIAIQDLEKKQEIETLDSAEMFSLKRNKTTFDTWQTSLNGINAIQEPFVTSESLINYCVKNFDKYAQNNAWLTYAAKQLFDKKQIATPVFSKIANNSYKIDPTAKAAYYQALSVLQSGKLDLATQIFDESAEKTFETNEKATIYYTIATTVFGFNNKVKAKEYLEKALEANPKFGKPYLYLAELYAASSEECGSDFFNKKAINWLVAKTIEKAGVDFAYKNSVKSLADKYRKLAPSKAEITKWKQAGNTITFDCWFKETITVPKI